jgi:tetratricopeptide (TPR) repeat protein
MSISSARIEELQKKFDENPRRYFAPLANEYRKAGHVDEAIALCRAHLPQQPGHMSGHIVFGQALYEKGELDQAGDVFQTALQLDPENLIALRHLGDIARERNDIEGARAWFRRVLDADPRNEEIVAQLAALDGIESATATPYDLEAVAPEAHGSAAARETDEVGPDHRVPSREFGDDGLDDSDLLATQLAALSGAIENDHHAAAHTPLVVSAVDENRHGAPGEAPLDTLELDVEGFGLPEGEAPAPVAPTAASDRDAVGAPEFDVAGFVDAQQQQASGAPTGETAHADHPWASAASAGEPSAPNTPEDHLGVVAAEFVPPAADDAAPAAPAGWYTDAESASGATPAGAPDEDGRPAPTPPAFVTETMAGLYLQQGFRQEALIVYRQLVEQNPSDAGLRERVERLEREIADEGAGAASVAAPDVPEPVGATSTAGQAEAESLQTVRQLFAAVVAKRPPQGGSAAVGGAAGGSAARHAALGEMPPVGLDEVSPTHAPSSATAEGEPGPATAEAGRGAEAHRGTASGALADVSTAVATPPDVGLATGVASLDSLFGAGAGQGRDEGSSSLIADLYAPTSEVRAVPARDRDKGAQPERTASPGLSLDYVFGKTPRQNDGTRRQPTFSFDQFFSGDAVADKPRPAQPESAAPQEDDGPNPEIAQFNAWLEGLKKK